MKWIAALFVALIMLACPFVFLTTSYAQDKPTAWEVYFSPKGGCTEAIIREMDRAKNSILVQAYSFTSAPIAKALLNAHKRGGKVEVILDKSQRTDKYSSATFSIIQGYLQRLMPNMP